jgi:hypothetical protein
MTDDFLCDDGHVIILFTGRAGHLPIYPGRVRRNPAVNLSVEVFHNLQPALLPPDLCVLHLLPILQYQRIRQARVCSSFRLIKIRGMGRLRVAVRATSQRSDMQQVQSALMVLLGSQLQRWRRTNRGLNGKIDRSSERKPNQRQQYPATGLQGSHNVLVVPPLAYTSPLIGEPAKHTRETATCR